MDSHELPLGSIPPVAPVFAISAAGLAPNAAEHNTTRKAITTTTRRVDSARPRWRFNRCVGMVTGSLPTPNSLPTTLPYRSKSGQLLQSGFFVWGAYRPDWDRLGR